MRIEYFVPSCTPSNSHGRYVIELATRFCRAHDVTVHSGSFWPPLKKLVRCKRLPVPNRPAALRLLSLWSTASLNSLRRRESDIVHIQGADAPNGNVVTAHYCNAAARGEPELSRRWNHRLNSVLGSRAERHCYSKYSTRVVIAVCSKVKDEIQRFYRTAPEKVLVIPLGVDPVHFNPANRNALGTSARSSMHIAEAEFVICFVGGDYRRKGLITLLKAVREVKGSPHVIGVGVHPDHPLNRAVEELGLDQRVHLTPHTEDPAPYYAAADCYALPTRYDNFSLATLEAMASGLPPLITRAAGISEYLTHGADSLILDDPEDEGAITKALQQLIDDQAVRLRLSAGARKTAEAYSWDAVAERTLAAYRLAL